MAISLYPHNAKAYDAAAMLAEAGKAAIIHPTGTGKSFIGFKLCEDHPNARICWLSPSEYIFKTQLENLTAAGAELPANILFFTYARLMLLLCSGRFILGYPAVLLFSILTAQDFRARAAS